MCYTGSSSSTAGCYNDTSTSLPWNFSSTSSTTSAPSSTEATTTSSDSGCSNGCCVANVSTPLNAVSNTQFTAVAFDVRWRPRDALSLPLSEHSPHPLTSLSAASIVSSESAAPALPPQFLSFQDITLVGFLTKVAPSGAVLSSYIRKGSILEAGVLNSNADW